MTDQVNPSPDRNAHPYQTAQAIRYAALSDGWIAEADTAYLADTEGDLSGAPLNAFERIDDGSAQEIEIDSGEAFIGGAWLARDESTTVAFDSDGPATVKLGWAAGSPNTVIIGEDSDFSAKDPRITLFEVDVGSGEINDVDDKRPVGPQIDDATVAGTTSTTIPAARLGSGESARVFEFVPDGSELRLLEFVAMNDAGEAPGGLEIEIRTNERSGQSTLESWAGERYQSGEYSDPLATISGEQAVEILVRNDTDTNPDVFSARFDYVITDE